VCGAGRATTGGLFSLDAIAPAIDVARGPVPPLRREGSPRGSASSGPQNRARHFFSDTCPKNKKPAARSIWLRALENCRLFFRSARRGPRARRRTHALRALRASAHDGRNLVAVRHKGHIVQEKDCGRKPVLRNGSGGALKGSISTLKRFPEQPAVRRPGPQRCRPAPVARSSAEVACRRGRALLHFHLLPRLRSFRSESHEEWPRERARRRHGNRLGDDPSGRCQVPPRVTGDHEAIPPKLVTVSSLSRRN
jgi:hypothetical protein